MKAREYYEKYSPLFLNPARDLPPRQLSSPEEGEKWIHAYCQQVRLDVRSLFNEFLKEIKVMYDERHAQSKGAVESILAELNQKWNALSSILVKMNGFSPIKHDGFIKEYRRLEKEVMDERIEKGEPVW